MKIEMISENQIRCTLTKEDLAARHIKLSELAYGTTKARLLFREMIEKATADYGFVTEDIPLMIEAIPMSSDGIVLLISKVNEPEELDTRFSEFTAYDEDSLDDSMISDMEEIQHSEEHSLLDFFKKLYEKLEKGKADTISSALSNNTVIVSFTSMNNIIRLAKDFKDIFTGNSSLYRSPKGELILVLKFDNSADENIKRLCFFTSEYGKVELSLNGSETHIAEHYTTIIKNDALQILSVM